MMSWGASRPPGFIELNSDCGLSAFAGLPSTDHGGCEINRFQMLEPLKARIIAVCSADSVAERLLRCGTALPHVTRHKYRNCRKSAFGCV